MRWLKSAAMIAAILSLSLAAFSAEDDSYPGPIEQAESIGDEQYITDSGKVFQTESLGEGEYMTDDGNILQEGPDGELMTEDQDSIQVDE